MIPAPKREGGAERSREKKKQQLHESAKNVNQSSTFLTAKV